MCVVFHFHHQLSSNLVVSSTEHAEQRVGISHRPDIWVRYGFIGGKFGLSQAFRPRISSPKVNKGPLISHCIAIVWSWKYRDTFSLMIQFIACFFDFVATNNIVQLIILQETIGHVLKKIKNNSYMLSKIFSFDLNEILFNWSLLLQEFDAHGHNSTPHQLKTKYFVQKMWALRSQWFWVLTSKWWWTEK